MVQLMGSLHFDKVEDFTEEEYGPLAKRSRSSSAQRGSANHDFPIPPSQYNPLDEPSPLGLRLKKSPSLLDLIQMRLSQGSNGYVSVAPKKDTKGVASSSVNDKLKASNFTASFLRIGSWEYTSKYEGDLVAKFYFAKHKLVWEVLEGVLKCKMEMQWSDIMALKAECPDNGPGTLTILARQPLFFKETNPQPRKHTLWQATSDFTDGQASKNKQHYIECPPGVLNKQYEKLIQCDMHLSIISQQPEIVMDSPYFEVQTSVSETQDEENPVEAKHVSKEMPSPSSVMDTHAIEGNKIVDEHDSHDSEEEKNCEGLEVQGLRSSISVSDLVNHIGNCISDQVSSGNLPSQKASECQDMLENISQVLLSDNQQATGLDEKSLMRKVNSLCCLLQDPVIASSAQVDGENRYDRANRESFDFINGSIYEKASNIMQDSEGGKRAPALQRRDSLSDFLLHLPRIASLPKNLSGIVEDDD